MSYGVILVIFCYQEVKFDLQLDLRQWSHAQTSSNTSRTRHNSRIFLHEFAPIWRWVRKDWGKHPAGASVAQWTKALLSWRLRSPDFTPLRPRFGAGAGHRQYVWACVSSCHRSVVFSGCSGFLHQWNFITIVITASIWPWLWPNKPIHQLVYWVATDSRRASASGIRRLGVATKLGSTNKQQRLLQEAAWSATQC